MFYFEFPAPLCIVLIGIFTCVHLLTCPTLMCPISSSLLVYLSLYVLPWSVSDHCMHLWCLILALFPSWFSNVLHNWFVSPGFFFLVLILDFPCPCFGTAFYNWTYLLVLNPRFLKTYGFCVILKQRRWIVFLFCLHDLQFGPKPQSSAFPDTKC